MKCSFLGHFVFSVSKPLPVKAILKYVHLVICFSIFNVNFIKAQGIITTIAGNGITQYIGDGSPAHSFSLALPKSIYVNKKGKVYIADNANNRIRTVYHDTLSTIVGSSVPGDTGDGGLADTATLRDPDGVCLDTAGNIYITEWYNDLIRKVDVHTGIISTICGITGGGFGGDGGLADTARLGNPGGVCTDAAGNIYIPDYNNHRIRKISVADGVINTIAGTGVNSYSGDSGLAINATLSYPNSVCVDVSGNVYFSEYGNNTIRRIDALTGIITTVAGTGAQGYSGDGDLATHAELAGPSGIFVDKHNYIYLAEYKNNVVRLITPTDTIYTIAGTGGYGYTGDNGPPLNATFNNPTAVYTDDSGYLYIADGHNSVIRKITPIDTIRVGIKEVVRPSFNIYPNPSSGKFSIISAEQTSADVKITNTIGQCVYNTSCTCNRIDIDFSSYPKGVYFIQYITSEQGTTKKIIIH